MVGRGEKDAVGEGSQCTKAEPRGQSRKEVNLISLTGDVQMSGPSRLVPSWEYAFSPSPDFTEFAFINKKNTTE